MISHFVRIMFHGYIKAGILDPDTERKSIDMNELPGGESYSRYVQRRVRGTTRFWP
jgi:hypothetical protein